MDDCGGSEKNTRQVPRKERDWLVVGSAFCSYTCQSDRSLLFLGKGLKAVEKETEEDGDPLMKLLHGLVSDLKNN